MQAYVALRRFQCAGVTGDLDAELAQNKYLVGGKLRVIPYPRYSRWGVKSVKCRVSEEFSRRPRRSIRHFCSRRTPHEISEAKCNCDRADPDGGTLCMATPSHTWVGGKRNDNNAGTQTSPYATFQTAVNNTKRREGSSPWQELGEFGAVTISHSVTIDGARSGERLRSPAGRELYHCRRAWIPWSCGI